MKAQTSSWPSPVGTLQSQVFTSRRVGENFWPGIAAALLVRVMEVGCDWCEDSPSANCVESSCSMAHGGGNRGSFFEAIFGFGFCFPSFLSVFKQTPKSVSKIEAILASDFSLLGWFLGTNIFVETLYSVFACTYKQAELIGLFPSQLNHRQASICMLLRCSKNTGGYWNWSTILETFCEADCGVGIRCNGCGPMNASVAGVYCFGSLFWEALGTKRPSQVRLLWFSHSNGMWGVCLRFWQDVFGCGIFLPAQLLLTPWSVWALAWQRLGFLNFAFADS